MIRSHLVHLPLALMFVLGGCESGVDSARDASASEADSGGGAADSGLEAPSDDDGDGVLDLVDCDPASADAGATGSRSCSNVCGAGTETCTDGVWSACDATTECLCSTPGATRAASCGMCGMRGEACSDGAWTATSECLGQGACAPGMTEERYTALYCWREQRLCGADCAWGEWLTVERGECEAGRRICDPPEAWLCTSDCRRVANPDCDV